MTHEASAPYWRPDEVVGISEQVKLEGVYSMLATCAALGKERGITRR
jgi:hypothetical protein